MESQEKSPQASSNQRKQLDDDELNLTHESNPNVHSSSEQTDPIDKELSSRVTETSELRPSNMELLAALQSKQTQGTSFSRAAPFLGGSLAQFRGANEDLSAVYLHSISNSYDHHQQFELNLLASSSRLQRDIGSSQISNAVMMPETPIPLRPTRIIQGTPSGFDLGSGSSSYAKSPVASSLKRKMIWQDEKFLSYQSWKSPIVAYQRYNSSNFDIDGGRYTLYDKRFEAIGLAVDPHLRIFNATHGNGNGESSKNII